MAKLKTVSLLFPKLLSGEHVLGACCRGLPRNKADAPYWEELKLTSQWDLPKCVGYINASKK